MKTAVEELIDDLLSGKITDTLAKSDYYLEKEKQQIIDANNAGWRTHRRKENQNALEYYNETFKND